MAENVFSRWTSGVLHNLVANFVGWAVLGFLGLVGVYFTKLTPVVARFAPLSYLAAFLVTVLLLLLIATLGVALWRRIRPPPPSAPALSVTMPDSSGAITMQVVADAEARLGELINLMKEELESSIAAKAAELLDHVNTPTASEQFFSLKERIVAAEEAIKIAGERSDLHPPTFTELEIRDHHTGLKNQRYFDKKHDLEGRFTFLVTTHHLVPQETIESTKQSVADNIRGDAQYLPSDDRPLQDRVAERERLIEARQWKAYIQLLEIFRRGAKERMDSLASQVAARSR